MEIKTGKVTFLNYFIEVDKDKNKHFCNFKAEKEK